MIADPEVNRTSLFQQSKLDSSSSIFAALRWGVNAVARSFHNLRHLVTRVSASKVTATTLMCIVAEKDALELDEQHSEVDGAPVFRSLQRVRECSGVEKADRREARAVLWQLAEKWTRLDSHPQPVPLPPRVGD